VEEVASLLEARKVRPEDGGKSAAFISHIGEPLSLALRDPSLGVLVDAAPSIRAFLEEYVRLPVGPADGSTAGRAESCLLTAVLDARYSGYVEKEERLASRVDRSERMRIPADFDYSEVPGLSKEAREKLAAVRPLSLGQASRVPGVRKSDSALLYVVLARRARS
jgi:tRNA uridine 5-carboxymethylaminomethyl modification enzyme